MIDVSKIRVGDHLDIRMRVTRVSVDGHDREFCLEYDAAESRVVVSSRDHGDLILAHHPTPREFKPGDRVKRMNWGGAPIQWTFVASANGIAFCAHDNGEDTMYLKLSDLRHADESE
jgi:hypothetical protein